jgi:hypothetical protein
VADPGRVTTVLTIGTRAYEGARRVAAFILKRGLMRIGILSTYIDYHRRGGLGRGPLQPGIGPLIAALLPPHEDIHVLHETLERPDWNRQYDLLFISCLHPEFDRARQISHYWRKRGARTVLGGNFASTYSHLCRPYFDSIVVGDPEPTVPRVYQDFRQDRLQPLYIGSAYTGEVPAPRFDLVCHKQPIPLSFEVSRGCPFQCDFCALTGVGTRYHAPPVANIVRDVETARRLLRGKVPDWKLKIAMLVDNNAGGSLTHLRDLCRTMKDLDLLWATSVTFNVVNSRDNVRMMAESGARFLFTGLESFNPEAIEDMNKRQNTLEDTRRVIDLCHEHGIALAAGLLLNAQVDTVEYIRSIPDHLRESGLMVPAFFGFEAPIPGTPLFHRMAADPAPAFLPNALLCDFNGSTMVLRPRRAPLDKFIDAYKQTLAAVSSLSAKLRQIRANAPGFITRGQYTSALVDSLLHWNAVFRSPLPRRTFITGTDVPMPELYDVPFVESDFRSEAECRAILDPWRVTDGDGHVLPQWRQSDLVYGSKGTVNPQLAQLAV